MSDLCWYDDEPHPYEPLLGPMECYGCGASEDSLSIYNSVTGLGWCCSACKQGLGCECIEVGP